MSNDAAEYDREDLRWLGLTLGVAILSAGLIGGLVQAVMIMYAGTEYPLFTVTAGDLITVLMAFSVAIWFAADEIAEVIRVALE